MIKNLDKNESDHDKSQMGQMCMHDGDMVEEYRAT